MIQRDNLKNLVRGATFFQHSGIAITFVFMPIIASLVAKSVFEIMAEGDKDPQIIIDEKGLKQESDPKELEKLIDRVIKDNQDKVKEYKSGKDKLFGFFVGQAMKVSGGKACLLYTSPSPRDKRQSRMPSSA